MKEILKVKNLKKHYKQKSSFLGKAQAVKALDGVSFSIKKGMIMGLVGESGCGKSTLAKQITFIESPTDGTIAFDGKEIVEPSYQDKKNIHKKVQMVFQNPFSSLNPRKKVGTILEEPLLMNTSLNKKERRQFVDQLLQKVGLQSHHYECYPHMFSGGQRQRIAIARALTLNPELIIADEPVSALDISVQAQILNLLLDLKENDNVALLFISHDLNVVKHISDEILVMYLGKIIEKGANKDIFEHTLHPYTQALLSSTPSTDRSVKKERIVLEGELPSPINKPSGCAFRTRCKYATERCAKEEPKLREVFQHEVACHHAEKIFGKIT